MYRIVIAVCVLLLGTSPGVQGADYWSYTPITDPKNDPDLIVLAEGAEPQILLYQTSAQLALREKELKNAGYVKIGSYLGHPSFKVPKNKKRAIDAAKEAGASLILAYNFVLPDFYALSKSAITKLAAAQSKKPASTGGDGTTIGVEIRNLTLEERTSLERNTGAFIVTTIDDSPAFNANVVPKDVLIAVNGLKVKNATQAQQLISAVDTMKKLTITVIRKGKIKDIAIKF